jgi:hypothetical protein
MIRRNLNLKNLNIFSKNTNLNLLNLRKFNQSLNNKIFFNFTTKSLNKLKLSKSKNISKKQEEINDDIFYEKVITTGYDFEPLKEYEEKKLRLKNFLENLKNSSKSTNNKIKEKTIAKFNKRKNIIESLYHIKVNQPEIEILPTGQKKYIQKFGLQKRELDRPFISKNYEIKLDKKRNRFIRGLKDIKFSHGKYLVHDFSVGDISLVKKISEKNLNSLVYAGFSAISLYFQNIILTPFFLYLFINERKKVNFLMNDCNKIKKISLLKNGKQSEIVLESNKTFICKNKNIRRLSTFEEGENKNKVQEVLIRHNNIDNYYEIHGKSIENREEVLDLIMNGISFDFDGKLKELDENEIKKEK